MPSQDVRRRMLEMLARVRSAYPEFEYTALLSKWEPQVQGWHFIILSHQELNFILEDYSLIGDLCGGEGEEFIGPIVLEPDRLHGLLAEGATLLA